MNEVDAARGRARRLYASRGFRGAYVKGAAARLHGRPLAACPYRRTADGWSAWAIAWRSGWRSIDPDLVADDD